MGCETFQSLYKRVQKVLSNVHRRIVLGFLPKVQGSSEGLSWRTGSRWSTSGTPTNQVANTTQRIKSISREARQNELISERLNEWQAKMREKGKLTLYRIIGWTCSPWIGTCTINTLQKQGHLQFSSKPYIILKQYHCHKGVLIPR